MRTLTVGKNDAGQRADKFLQKTLNGIPTALLYKYFRKKCIKINGSKATPEVCLKAGDLITLYISDEFFPSGHNINDAIYMRDGVTLKQSEIIYQDENIMIIDKPQGELVHSSLPDEESRGTEICLVDRFLGYLYKSGQYNPDTEQSFVPSLCNRLDRNTCGLVIAAKNANALRIMNQKVKDREMIKLYHTVVIGKPKKDSAVLKDFLYKDRKQNRVFIASSREQLKRLFKNATDSEIKTIITKYKVLKSDKDKSLLEVELVTGRTHQIRAHLAYIGTPIAGDGKYGINHSKDTGEKYQQLCSYSLKFKFTTDAGELNYLDNMTFKSKYDFAL